MSVRDEILYILENNRGNTISGTWLARELSISRNTVWKVIKRLQEEGYLIHAVTNRGYCFANENDIVSSQSILPYIRVENEDLRIEVHKTMTSTNDVMKNYAKQGELEGKVLICEEQTKGRGRYGRSFYSPGTGIYMSILLRPTLTIEDSLLITSMAAVAVARAIESVANTESKIKWVNDIFCNGKKVCGILTEAGIDFESGNLEYAVVGIGINVMEPEQGFPDDLKDIATSIFHRDTYQSNCKSQLVAEVLNLFWEYYNSSSMKTCIEEYRARSFLIGQDVVLLTKEEPVIVKVIDIDQRARLCVQYPTGEIEILNSGEVSIAPIRDSVL